MERNHHQDLPGFWIPPNTYSAISNHETTLLMGLIMVLNHFTSTWGDTPSPLSFEYFSTISHPHQPTSSRAALKSRSAGCHTSRPTIQPRPLTQAWGQDPPKLHSHFLSHQIWYTPRAPPTWHVWNPINNGISTTNLNKMDGPFNDVEKKRIGLFWRCRAWRLLRGNCGARKPWKKGDFWSPKSKIMVQMSKTWLFSVYRELHYPFI